MQAALHAPAYLGPTLFVPARRTRHPLHRPHARQGRRDGPLRSRQVLRRAGPERLVYRGAASRRQEQGHRALRRNHARVVPLAAEPCQPSARISARRLRAAVPRPSVQCVHRASASPPLACRVEQGCPRCDLRGQRALHAHRHRWVRALRCADSGRCAEELRRERLARRSRARLHRSCCALRVPTAALSCARHLALALSHSDESTARLRGRGC
mmetsp:Transcript_39831/g.84921  ORF Transcript_39831/g.84921 Transcript_39831/m.84921 type:complete len:213 (+) Transcript_39831:543-1181(+)